MDKEYVPPQLTMAGDASQIVLGLSLPGTDFRGSDIGGDMEFEIDDGLPSGTE